VENGELKRCEEEEGEGKKDMACFGVF